MAKNATFMFEGKEYQCKAAAAKHLIDTKKMSQSDAARAVGIAPASVSAWLNKDSEVSKARRAKYDMLNKVKRLGNAQKYSVGQIAERAGISTSKVSAILKEFGIASLSAKALASKMAKDVKDDSKAKPAKSKKAKTKKETPKATEKKPAKSKKVDKKKKEESVVTPEMTENEMHEAAMENAETENIEEMETAEA